MSCLEGVYPFRLKLPSIVLASICINQSRFRVAYMYCGCPPPGDTFKQKVLSKLKCESPIDHAPTSSHPMNIDLLPATHPSDHNAVFAFHLQSQSEASRRNRRTKVRKRRQRDADKVKQGKLDRSCYQPGEEHGPAFLTPVPVYHIYGHGGCTAFQGGIYGGCAGQHSASLTATFI